MTQGAVDTPSPLDDLRVLDLAGEAAAYCTKLLADLGADVIKVEPPGGDPARRVGPFFHDEVDLNKSLYFFAFNTNKRSITLDIASADGKALFQRLVAGADVLVETFPAGSLEELGLGYPALAAINPRLIHCSITGFGLWGPHAHYQASDLIAIAMSGMMYLAGYPEDPPNRPYGNQAYYCASIQAASGVLTALIHRDGTGEGQFVEVSMQEALSLNQETAMQYWDLRKELRRRIGEGRRMPDGTFVRYPGIGTYEARDGHVFLMIGVPGFGAPLPTLIDWMAEEGLAEDLTSPEWKNVLGQMDLRLLAQLIFAQDPEAWQQWAPRFRHIDPVIQGFVAAHTKGELYEKGQRRGLLVAPVNSPKDVVENPQLQHRKWFVEVTHEELGATIQYPGPPYRLAATPWRLRRRPPLLGEHNREVYMEELGLSAEELATLSAAGVI